VYIKKQPICQLRKEKPMSKAVNNASQEVPGFEDLYVQGLLQSLSDEQKREALTFIKSLPSYQASQKA
jgi:hypothetical protein